MKFRRLEYFVAVAEELNFSKAAVRLHMSQPPLSQQIQQLERELGQVLFDRNSRKVTLTAAGEVLLVEARYLLYRYEKSLDVVRQSSNGYQTTVTLGCITSSLAGFLPRLMPLIREHLPEVLVHVLELQTGEQFAALNQQMIDIGILRTQSPPDNYQLYPLGIEPLFVALPADHPLASMPRVRLKDLATSTFSLYSRHVAPEAFDTIINACSRAGFMPRITSESHSGHATVALVAAGLGVSIVPESTTNVSLKNLVYRPLDPPVMAAQLQLAVPKGRCHPHIATIVQLAQSIQHSEP